MAALTDGTVATEGGVTEGAATEEAVTEEAVTEEVAAGEETSSPFYPTRPARSIPVSPGAWGK